VDKKNKVEIEKHQAHFGPISQEIRDHVTNFTLKDSRYLFIKTQLRMQYAYCTHCKEWHKPKELLLHNKEANCRNCNSKCMVKKAHVGRKYMVDKAYLVYYQKSILDPTIMTAIGLFVKRDYTGDYLNVETQYYASSSYVFEIGKSNMLQTSYYNKLEWYMCEKIKSEYSYYSNGTPCGYSRNSIKEAIKGTPFQYSAWEQFHEGDMVKFFDLYSNYPLIEYLTKMGFSYFVKAKLYGLKTYGAINWKGKNIEQILRLNKQDLREVKNLYEIDPFALRLFQITRKENNRLSLIDIQEFTNKSRDCFEDLKKIMKLTSLTNYTDAINFIKRQYNRPDEKPRYERMGQVVITWRDYISDCIKLNLSLNDERTVFPSNLFSSHQKSNVRLKNKLDKDAKVKLTKRINQLQKFAFEHDGLILRPFESVKEIVDEGNKLNICIGGSYPKRYVDGETDLFCIRKVDALNKPFYSMEIRNGEILQTQGKNHCLPDVDVQKFIQAFKAEKLDKKPSRKRSNNKIEPVERQGVAV
jgi:DNA-directed RNA polymerase subunit RPC12/RpoP